MSVAATVRVTIYDPDTGIVTQEIVQQVSEGGAHGYEIERQFRQLGEQIAPLIDPYYQKD